MAYRYRSRRSVKRLARKSRRNFIVTLIIVILLIYSAITWVLPFFVNSIGFITNIIKPPQKKIIRSFENPALAPPVLSIPYEATNTAQIDIKGFGTPGSKVKLYIDELDKQTVDVSGDGSFILQNVMLAIGTNNLYGTTVDDQNKESLPSKTIRLIYIYENPILEVNEPEDGKAVQGGDKKIKVSGKTSPNVKIFINDSQVIVDRDGNFSADQPLNEGGNTISIKAIDTASNTTGIQRQITYTP